MLQWIYIDKDWGKVYKSMMFSPKKKIKGVYNMKNHFSHKGLFGSQTKCFMAISNPQ